ncbi:MAG: protein jag [Chloroflexi bacterium]|nr:protein jag [Chloroflexota bacterium]
MEEQSLEITGKTVEEAIEIATLELGVGREGVAVDVVSHGRSGILGIGSEPAKVRVRRIDANGIAGDALSIVSRILKSLDVIALASIRSIGADENEPAVIDIQGEDAGLLIGKRGETLRSLQMLVNMMLSQQTDHQSSRMPVILDIEHYRKRKERNLQRLAEKMANRASETGNSVELEYMNASDRRIVHMALSSSKSVTTESKGEGQNRRVMIIPSKK